MNWASISFDWNHARAFLAVVEEGSLSAAARVLEQTQPTIGRQITALEARLGVTLFERTARSLKLTPFGHKLAEQVRAMATAANQVTLAATGQSQGIEGSLRITASDVFSSYLLPDFVRTVRAQAPRLCLEINATNDIRDLVLREADIAIRHVRPRQRELVARKIGLATAHLYAARPYLHERGRPESVAALREHDFVFGGSREEAMAYMQNWGLPVGPDNYLVGTDSGLVAWDLVRRSFGISPMADFVADRTENVERLELELPPVRFPVWLVTHRELHTSRKIRTVFDLLADYLKSCGVVQRAPTKHRGGSA